MKTLFWNIGKHFNDNKGSVLSSLINNNSPNVVCIAEGSYSQVECEKLVDLVTKDGYKLYYSPTLGKESKTVDYKRNGLKVFYKDCTLSEKFDFTHSRENGRIIRLQLEIEDKTLTIVFLHNYSKNGDRESTKEQVIFISQLNQMIANGQLDDQDSYIMILGDFNLEPWDNILRNPRLLDTYFLRKHLNFEKEKSRKKALMYNPLTEKIIKEDNKIGGTYFSKNMGWALYDYPIYNEKAIELEYQIISMVNGNEILNRNSDFDHLPIITTLK